MGPLVYLCLALGVAIPIQFGTMKVLEAKRVTAALAEGKRVGAAEVAARVAAKAQDTVNRATEGEASAPVIPEDKVALQALCDRSASCRSRRR